MAPVEVKERRKYPRLKLHLPVEIRADNTASSIHVSTTDLSLGGCYIESIFPFPVGTTLDLRLQIGDTTVPIAATVVTSDPQVGNGILFARMLPEDRRALETFLNTAS